MLRNLILSGGVAHDYAATSTLLAGILQEADIRSDIREDLRVVEDDGLGEYDLLTLNCVRWTCNKTPFWKDEWGFEFSDPARRGFLNFLADGKGLLALHCATICFDDWPDYREILGAWWEWGHSGHAPLQEQPMTVHRGAHAIVEGVGDFMIFDELYTDPIPTDTIEPLIEAEWEGRRHPILWRRQYGAARVCYNALGHGTEAFEHPSNRLLLKRGALWVSGHLAEGGP